MRERKNERMKERKNEKKEATQQQLSKDGLSEKETESRATDKRRNADLIKLRVFQRHHMYGELTFKKQNISFGFTYMY